MITLLENKNLLKTEAVDEEGYERFKAACQSNTTYKAAAAICKKYGYRLVPCCYVETLASGAPSITFGIVPPPSSSYLPEIFYYGFGFNGVKTFRIQTSSYGSLELDEHQKWLDAQIGAHKMVAELAALDLTTLYKVEESLEEGVNFKKRKTENDDRAQDKLFVIYTVDGESGMSEDDEDNGILKFYAKDEKEARDLFSKWRKFNMYNCRNVFVDQLQPQWTSYDHLQIVDLRKLYN